MSGFGRRGAAAITLKGVAQRALGVAAVGGPRQGGRSLPWKAKGRLPTLSQAVAPLARWTGTGYPCTSMTGRPASGTLALCGKR